MDEKQLIRKHLELVLEANETTNLTRIDTFDEGMLLHVEDSLAGLDEVEQAPPGLYGDMGTGGGYPGIPLAIMTKRETVLIDSVRKKTDILRDIIKELGLSAQVEVFNGRLEELSCGAPGCFLRFDSTRFVTNGFAHGISGSPSCLGRPFDLLQGERVGGRTAACDVS